MIEAIITTPERHSRFRYRIDKLVSRFNELEREPREVILAILVGLLAGLGAVLLRQAIYFVYLAIIAFPLYLLQGLGYSHYYNILGFIFKIPALYTGTSQEYYVMFAIVFSLTLGGAIVGLLNIIFPPVKGDHGIPQVINAVENNQGRLPYKYPIIGLIKSAITIGSSGAVGREGPVVQIGGGSGSAVGRFFRVTPEEKRTLIMAGVAGGISATFNAPIGGLMFSFELFRRGERSPRLLPLLVSSVVGTAISNIFLGTSPFLDFSVYSQYSYNPANFVYFVVMGVILGVVSVIWIVGYNAIAGFFENKVKMSRVLKPALGGLLLGIIYLIIIYVNIISTNKDNIIALPMWIELPSSQSFPQYLSNSLQAMDAVITSSAKDSNFYFLGIAALIIFVVALVGNGIILGSGGSGGQLAPTLLMGLMLGAVFAALFEYLSTLGLNLFGINVGLLEVLAMAAFFAGSTRLPMTSIILTAEIVGDFKLTIPLMFTVSTAWMISRLISREDLFSISLKHKGIISEIDTPTEYLQDMPVREIMTTNVVTVEPKDRAEHVIDLIHETGHNGFPVVENDQLVGIITTRDFIIAMQSGKDINELIVSTCAVMDHVVTIVPECPIVTAIIIMNSRHINRLPVIEGEASHKVVGLVTRADLNRASLKFGLTAKHNRFEDSLFDSDFIIQLDKAKSS